MGCQIAYYALITHKISAGPFIKKLRDDK